MASTVWKGHLTFGLLSLPVKLYSAARSETVSFNQLHKADNSRVKQVLYCQAEDKPIQRSEIVKGYEYEKDKYVVIDEEEVKKVAPKTAKTMEIQEFVKSADVDPIFFESSYYMAPDEAGEKPYALLFEAMRMTGCLGVAKVAMHNREHVVILRPGSNGILLHTMYYRDEIRQVDEFRTDKTLVKDKELALAKNLVESLLSDFDPDKYKDGYRENLMSMIKAKVEGKEIVETAVVQHRAPVIDILEALKMSIQEAKKPVVSVRGASEEDDDAARTKRSRKSSAGD
ncbi:MAG TPA: Ku protein [Alphaproteobacteria bacterium]|nr:Ku protein [Alphaproteobacteria bacterium]